jgi:hypothetical protein
MQVTITTKLSFANLETEVIRKMTTDLRGKLRAQVENIYSCAKDVKKAIDLAKATSDRKEQEFQEQERKLAAKHRMEFSIFTSRVWKELESAREWQVQREQEFLSKFYGSLSILNLTSTGEKKKKLLDSLSMYAYQRNFHHTRKKRHVNTATWLFSTSEFVTWKDGETPSVFLLTGKRKFSLLCLEAILICS